MGIPVPANTDVWRVVLLRRNGCEFMVSETDSGPRLPIVEIPTYSRVALELNARVKTLCGLDAYPLYPIPASDAPPAARYHVVEALHDDEIAPATGRWISLQDAGNAD